jgi:predicted transcriptional regulator
MNRSQPLPSLGELELGVLRLVWEHQPCTERQVSDLMAHERPLARTTVLKTMQRLEAKGLLRRLPGKGPVRFRAVLDQGRVMPALVRRFVKAALGGSLEPLVAYMADSDKLSADDLQTLRVIARKLADEPHIREE